MESGKKPLRDILSDPDGWPGMVYFLQGGSGEPIKIGYVNESSDKQLSKRVSTLQTGNPDRLSDIYRIDPAYMPLEKAIHKLLSPWRVRENGEWFEYSAATALINTLQHSWADTLFQDQIERIPADFNESLTMSLSMHYTKLIDNLITAPELPLLGWLLLQEERDDIVGDLAEDAKRKPEIYLDIRNLEGYASVVPEITWPALAKAYFECYSDIKDLVEYQ